MQLENAYNLLIDTVENILENDPPTITIENNGIGHYEYWGAVGFDKGQDYPVIEETEQEIRINFNFAKRLLNKLVDYANDCDTYESFVHSYVSKKYDDDEFTVHFKINNVSLDNNELVITIEWGNVQ